jgi:hypothetical protein
MSDNAGDGTYVDVRIFPALASDAPWFRLPSDGRQIKTPQSMTSFCQTPAKQR